MSKSTAVALAAARGEEPAPVAMSEAKLRNLARANVRTIGLGRDRWQKNAN